VIIGSLSATVLVSSPQLKTIKACSDFSEYLIMRLNLRGDLL
jgi:hypothetical protein